MKNKERTTRLVHTLWTGTEYIMNPLSSVRKVLELDENHLKIIGMTDLWKTLNSAPEIEKNIELIKNTFHIDVGFNDWNRYTSIIPKQKNG